MIVSVNCGCDTALIDSLGAVAMNHTAVWNTHSIVARNVKLSLCSLHNLDGMGCFTSCGWATHHIN
jgi:hypothetical protein